MIHRYEIKQSDSFSEHLYPHVAKELIGLRQSSSQIQSPAKTEIIISFLKEHSIKRESLETNREISKLMTSGSLAISHLESLFDACRNNARFSKELEEYIKFRIV